MIEPIKTKQDIEDMKIAITEQYPNATINPPLLEKMFYALSLAELLQIYGLKFIFKGGTSLILLLEYPQRFSIDIDIITKNNQIEIEAILDKICKKSNIFFRYELQEDRSYKGNIPKAHYKLFFNALETGQNDTHILLDILFDKNPYPQTEQLPINKKWLKTSLSITNVNVPTIESIVGDKLTAFAPNTTGIQYGKGKHTEIIKQMFDLGQLFDKVFSFEIVIKSFEAIANKEIQYRKLQQTTSIDIAKDIFQTCLEVVREENDELKLGIKTFKNWTFLRFNRDKAFLYSGKIAYISAKIIKNNTTDLQKTLAQKIDKKQFLITNPNYNDINKRTKNISNNALFYWFQAIHILDN
jgi:predicted nucleotidyltransferase component of viral defense system